jgi:pyrophosphatase PpaX
MKYDTVLFDLDGTIIDTNNLILQSFLHTLGHYFPGKYTEEHILPHMGQTLFEQMERFGGKERVDELVEHYREHNIRMHDELIAGFPHVAEVIPQLHQLGLSLGVVTTKMRNTAEMGLRLFDLERYMKVIITYEDTVEHKPHPAPVLKALELLGADPSKTIMVGDSEYDIQAGNRAGVATAGVSWSLKGEDYLRQFQPNVILQDLRELVPIVKGELEAGDEKDGPISD